VAFVKLDKFREPYATSKHHDIKPVMQAWYGLEQKAMQ
jgi:hypothetical protein